MRYSPCDVSDDPKGGTLCRLVMDRLLTAVRCYGYECLEFYIFFCPSSFWGGGFRFGHTLKGGSLSVSPPCPKEKKANWIWRDSHSRLL